MGTFQTYQERPGDPEEHTHENRTGGEKKKKRERNSSGHKPRGQQMFVITERSIFRKHIREGEAIAHIIHSSGTDRPGASG